MMGSTGDKGAAVLKISIDRTLAGRQLEFCFVGSHLDASSESTRDACPKVAQKTLCWDGLYTFEGCQEWGLCYYTSHCPLYTDRILFTSGVRTEISNRTRNQMHVV